MPAQDLLIEIGAEELPPKALSSLSKAFEELVTAALKKESLSFDSAKRFATPRRLALLIYALQEAQEDKQIERLGPAVSAAFDSDGNPTPAASGFAKSCGVDVHELARTEKDGVEKLSFSSLQQGQQTIALVPEIIRQALNQLPVPKRMRWGSSREEFVRPVHWLMLLFGQQVIDLEIYGVSSGNNSYGHRFLHNKAISLDAAEDYEECLKESGRVIPDFEGRKALIRELIIEEGEKSGAQTVVDEALLDEVTALVEYPVALTGDFDEEFLEVPAEALILAMKSHQKCFYLVDEKETLLPKFVTVSNIVSKDPMQVIEGNERVIRPRLADARFFFESDKKTPLASRMGLLRKIVFQEKLGTVYDKSVRVAKLAVAIAADLGADTDQCERAAMLSKCDLLTSMVVEFADLQGLMGSYYAQHDGEAEEVCSALNEQYLPRYAGDSLPESTTGAVLAMADKLDAMVGLFGIGQPPTGSKDPFALRRSAIGILRILVEKELDLDIVKAIEASLASYSDIELQANTTNQVFEFLLERFRAWYLETGISSEVFQSVFAMRPTRPLDFHHRIQAVHNFDKLPEAVTLAAANKRVSNLLSKQKEVTEGSECSSNLLTEAAEQSLHKEIQDKMLEVAPLFEQGDYTKGLQSLSTLKNSVDDFFDNVLVMHQDDQVRQNRLALLKQLRNLFLQTADISYLHSS